MLAGERSPRTPIASDRWGNYEIPELPAIDMDELERLKARLEDLVRKAAERLTET